MNEQDWNEQRKHGISASEIPAILGISPYQSPIDVYRRKIYGPGPKPEKEEPWLRWGRLLEPVIADAYAEDTHRILVTVDKPLVHPKYPIILGTPDRLVKGESRGVECKSAGAYAAKELFGEPGTDEIPDHYLIQAIIYMAITGRDWWDLPVLVGGFDFRIYTVHRDLELERDIIDRARDWWDRHVVKKIEPDLDWSSESTSTYLAAKYPVNEGVILSSDPTTDAYAYALAKCRSEITRLESAKTSLENHLKNVIGNADGLTGEFGKISWRKTKDSKTVDWEKLAKLLLARLPESESRALVPTMEKVKLGVRRFLFTPTKED